MEVSTGMNWLFAGRQLLLKAVNRVWTELMHSKRQMLEDIFKVSLPCNDRGHVDIATARPALEEPALKSWQNHLGEEQVLILEDSGFSTLGLEQ